MNYYSNVVLHRLPIFRKP